VYRAYDPQRNRFVAVKWFTVDLPADRVRHLVAEFERLITADLVHPGIAAPVATGVAGASAYLAHEFVEAESFDEAIRHYGPAPPADARRVVTQIAGALDFAAAVNVVHGALHPRDVLLSAGDTRITGLGVARALQRVGFQVPVRRPYSAPELIRGGGWDRRADVFTLAALFHELLWGRQVIGSASQLASTLTEVAGGDLAALRVAISRALADRPDDRFATALEFAEALELGFPAEHRRDEDEQWQPPLIEPAVAQPAKASGAAAPVRGVHDAGKGSSQPAARPALDLELRAAEPPGYRDAATAPARVAPSPPGPKVAAGTSAVDAAHPLTRRPGAEPSAMRPRSVWPIAAVLVIGIGLGFAVGYGLKPAGESATRPETSPAALPPADVPRPGPTTGSEPTPPPPPSSGREFTESAVPERPKASRPAAGSEPRSPTAAGPAAVEGRLLVRSEPAGATVIVDGREYGPTPAVVRGLDRGTHRVRIVREGYISEERSVDITRSQPAPSLIVTLEPRRPAEERIAQSVPQSAPTIESYTGTLVVESLPAGASVFLDNRAVGRTPLTLPRVNAGAHVVRLERDGYQRWTRSIRVVATERTRVTASLDR